MRIAKTSLNTQRQFLDNRLNRLNSHGKEPNPHSGWLKSVRGSLGLSTRRLGERMKTTPQVITRLEQRELQGAVTLKSLENAARAMNCRLVYAIVPEENYASFEAIVDERAMALAKSLAGSVAHSMRLEGQGVSPEITAAQIRELADTLKEKLDPRLWAK